MKISFPPLRSSCIVIALLAVCGCTAAFAQDAKNPAAYMELPGTLEALEQAEIYAKVSGYLDVIHVDIGDTVRAGDVIAVLSVPEMLPEMNIAEAAVEVALAIREKARADANLANITAKRYADLHSKEPGAITNQEVDTAKAGQLSAAAQVTLAQSQITSAEAEVERLKVLMTYATVRAPFDGVITKRFLDTGAMVLSGTSGGTPLVEIMRMDTLRLVTNIPEEMVTSVGKGTATSIKIDALGSTEELKGSITRIAERLMPDTRSMRAEIDLPNPGLKLKPGMFAKVRLMQSREGSSNE